MKSEFDWSVDADRTEYRFSLIIFRIILGAFVFAIAVVHIVQRAEGLPITRDLAVYASLAIGLLAGIELTKRGLKAGPLLFCAELYLILAYIDFFSVRNFNFDAEAPVFYLMAVATVIFFLPAPFNVAISAVFVATFVFRIVAVSKLHFTENYLLIVISVLSVSLMITVRLWIARMVKHKLRSLRELNSVTTEILGKIVELRDGGTSNHLNRVSVIVEEIIDGLRGKPEYGSLMEETYIENVKLAAMLHDIGKIGIPDKILLKPGKLSEDEFEVMKRHAIIGFDLLHEAKNKVQSKEFFELVIDVIRYHHERWDGSGYPDRLRRDDIPIAARVMAVADVYDALISDRPYKNAISHEEAVLIIRDGSGTTFDPEVVEIFLARQGRIRERMGDSPDRADGPDESPPRG